MYSLDAGKFKTAAELMNAAKSEPIAAKLVQQNIRFPHEFDATCQITKVPVPAGRRIFILLINIS